MPTKKEPKNPVASRVAQLSQRLARLERVMLDEREAHRAQLAIVTMKLDELLKRTWPLSRTQYDEGIDALLDLALEKKENSAHDRADSAPVG